MFFSHTKITQAIIEPTNKGDKMNDDNFYKLILDDFNNSCERTSTRIGKEVRNAKIRNMVLNTIVPVAVSIFAAVILTKIDNSSKKHNS